MSFNETQGLSGAEFFPYNDSTSISSPVLRIGSMPEDVIAIYTQSGSGMDTSAFDKLRQGVEMRRPVHVYGSTQPKLWAGNILHRPQEFIPYGEARTWTEYENTTEYYDNTIPFNPIQYITSNNDYPYPIYFNDGPQQGQEAIMEPLTIPFRAETSYIEGAFPVHRPKGNLEDGNPTSDAVQSNNRILQFIAYEAPLTSSPFLDGGQQYIGSGAIEDDIIIEGYVNFVQRLGNPFDDTENEEIVKQLSINPNTVSNQTFLSRLELLDINLDEDIRETYTQKSATAGYSVYGPEQGRYGTDSIAYTGWSRGS
jgi:hypothetical protein